MTRVRLLVCCKACSADKSVQIGHAEVEQQNVGIQLLHLVQHLAAVAGFAHDLEIVFEQQQFFQAVADDRMIVGDEDPNHRLSIFGGIHPNFVVTRQCKRFVHIRLSAARGDRISGY